MKVIGLTGGIGTGKSTVSRFLEELGAVVIDADKVGHETLRRGTLAWQHVVAAFGRSILGPDDEIDRKKLAEIVFHDRATLAKLNSVMHPPMYGIVKAKIDEYRRQGAEVVVLEAPLLIEASWTLLVDEVWVTVAPEETVIKRLHDLGLSRSEALARIRSQMPSEKRIEHADVIIDTTGILEEVRARVKDLWKTRVRKS